MFDTADILGGKGDIIAENLAGWETQSIAEMARFVGRIGRMSKEEAEKINAEGEARKEWERIITTLALATALNIRSLKISYASVFEEWHESNKPLYDYKGVDFTEVSQNDVIQDIIDRYAKQNARDIVSYTQTKALVTFDRNGNIIHFEDAIRKAFDEATQTVIQGKTDFYTAMRGTIQNLGGSGVRVNYGGGITRRLDTVARQNLLWNLKKAHREYDDAIGKELGCDGTEIDYHTNSRPSHRYMQGKQYSKGEGKTVNGIYYPSAEKEGVYDRLYEDYGCLHYETSIILGVSVPRYTEDELRRFEEQDNRLYKIGDVKKDGYGWSQAMRRLETETRKAKDEINALSALGGNKGKIGELRQRIKAYQAKYAEISDITGIAQEPKRMSVPRTPKKVTERLKSERNSGIIKTDDTQFLRIPQIPSSTVTRKIESGEYSTKLSLQQYNKHVLDTAQYNAYLNSRTAKNGNPQSVLVISEDEAQQIIINKAGTGIVRVDRKGNPKPQEDITCDKVIGKYYGGGAYHDTNKATIHYGKRGSHIVPMKGDHYD